MARTAIADSRFDEARLHADKCLSIWPRSPSLFLLAARSARLAGDFPAAEDYLNRCKKLQNGEASEATQLEFRLMRVQAGEVDEVAPELFVYVENGHPETSLILETIARSFMHHHRYGPAFNCLGLWIEKEPENAKPYHFRGWVLERMNNAKGAMIDYLQVIDLDPSNVTVRLRVVEMLLEDHKPLEAVPHLEILLTQAPDRPDVLARLGQCRYLQSDAAEARPDQPSASSRCRTLSVILGRDG